MYHKHHPNDTRGACISLTQQMWLISERIIVPFGCGDYFTIHSCVPFGWIKFTRKALLIRPSAQNVEPKIAHQWYVWLAYQWYVWLGWTFDWKELNITCYWSFLWMENTTQGWGGSHDLIYIHFMESVFKVALHPSPNTISRQIISAQIICAQIISAQMCLRRRLLTFHHLLFSSAHHFCYSLIYSVYRDQTSNCEHYNL